MKAIIGGERDGATLAKLRHGRIRASEEEITKALEGNWREEHLFALRQSVALYDAYAVQILECDRQLEVMLGRLAHYEGDPGPSKRMRSRACLLLSRSALSVGHEKALLQSPRSVRSQA